MKRPGDHQLSETHGQARNKYTAVGAERVTLAVPVVFDRSVGKGVQTQYKRNFEVLKLCLPHATKQRRKKNK